MSAERPEVATHGSSRRAMDMIVTVLGVWMFISPWVLAYGTGDAWSTWLASAIIVLSALSALNRDNVWPERINLVLGAWLFISPWVLAFSEPSAGASINQWIVGALVFIISGACMAQRRNEGPLHHAHHAH